MLAVVGAAAAAVGLTVFGLVLGPAGFTGVAAPAASVPAATSPVHSPGTHDVAPALRSFWESHSSEIGLPRAAAVTRDGAVVQTFLHGTMYASGGGQVGYVTGGLRIAYESLGARPSIGTPVGMQVCIEGERSCFQTATNGMLLWPGTSAAKAVTSDKTVRLDGAPNFRDAAGEGLGIPLSNGGHMRRGTVYRADDLSDATSADVLAIVALGVTDVFDLRTPGVAARRPDPQVPGATGHMSNLFGRATNPNPTATTVASAVERQQGANRRFVADRLMRAQLRKVLEGVARSKGSVIIHCTEGKDRTGWVSAMLQIIAGASEDEVVRDYLRSNDYRREVVAEASSRVRAREGAEAARVYETLHQVQAIYLRAGLEEARRRYGSVEAYLRDGVGLGESMLETLRNRLRAA